MAAPSQPSPDPGADTEIELDLRSVGDRIETLLEASSSNGAVARERTEELVRLLSELYGAGIERMMDLLYDHDALTPEVLGAFADDDLVASLLLVHGLHPEDVTARVERALDSVRPYLQTHGGNVELLGVTDDGVVRLRLLGSCDGCSSSAATMSLAVEDAVSQAAPEITSFDVDSPTAAAAAPAGRGLIPLAVLPHDSSVTAGAGATADSGAAAGPTEAVWHTIAELPTLATGEVIGMDIGGTAVIICRNGDDLLAFRDQCGACSASLTTARLERRLGGATGSAVLTCPACRAHFDVRLAGASIDSGDVHLSPLPLLTRAGGTAIALPQALTAARPG